MSVIKRIEEIDILKAFGIILMIMGHIGFGMYFDYWIHAFHMPMFYIISGFLYSHKSISIRKFIYKKVKSLLVPYFIFGIIHYFIYLLISISNNNSTDLFVPVLHLFFINTYGLPIAGALWFLTSLFFVDLIYYLIDRQNKINKNLLVVVITFIGVFLPKIVRLPYALDTAFVGTGLFHIGYILKNCKHFNIKENFINALFLIGMGSILIFLNGYINVREGLYSNVIIFVIVSVVMTVGLYILAKILIPFIPDILKNELIFIWKNSIVYLCLNQLVILIIIKAFYFIQLADNTIILLITKSITFVLSMIFLKIICYILNTKKLKFIIGK